MMAKLPSNQSDILVINFYLERIQKYKYVLDYLPRHSTSRVSETRNYDVALNLSLPISLAGCRMPDATRM